MAQVSTQKCSTYCFSDIDINKEICTNTQYEWYYQHFYKCLSCRGFEICLVCANVCHAGHDVRYYKYTKRRQCCCGTWGMDNSCRAKSQRFPIPEQNNPEQEPTTSDPLAITQGK